MPAFLTVVLALLWLAGLAGATCRWRDGQRWEAALDVLVISLACFAIAWNLWR